jgi:hypothetical protein
VLIAADVLSGPNQREARVFSAVIAWRKVLTENARDFVVLGVLAIVNNPINARLIAPLSGLENITNFNSHVARYSLVASILP